MSEILGKKISPEYKPANKNAVKRIVLDIEKAKRELKWHPKTSLKDGIRKTLRYIKDI